MRGIWTEEKITTLRCLWSAGLSGTEIAVEVGAPSRSAVIAKAHRLGLETRVKRRPPKLTKPAKVKLAKPITPADISAPLGTQAPTGCRFIYGHPKTDPAGWRYCSREVAERGRTPALGSDGVYCPDHLALMYDPDRPKRVYVSKGARAA